MAERDPFFIEGPACISFSGGRSSGYLLWRILEAHGGELPRNILVLFANTGKEREETLEFVRDCNVNWGVPIVWLEFVSRAADGFKVVDFATAARNGEPFDRLIEQKQRLPNVVERSCTEELKIRSMQRYLDREAKMDPDLPGAQMVVGVRADEPYRIPKLRTRDRLLPLVDAGKGKQDVWAFWRNHPFDLKLPYLDGYGNCDLCFQHTLDQVLSRVREEPHRAVWWMGHEKQRNARFNKDRPDYAAIHMFATTQADMFNAGGEAIPCFCGD